MSDETWKSEQAAALYTLVVALPDEDAEELLRELMREFCPHCYTRGGPGCQCWNDE